MFFILIYKSQPKRTEDAYPYNSKIFFRPPSNQNNNKKIKPQLFKVLEGWGTGYDKHTRLHNEIGCVILKFAITISDVGLSALPTFLFKESFFPHI